MAKLQPAYSPSAFQVSAAMSEAQRFAAALQEQAPDLDHDSMVLALDSETPVMDVLRQVVRASLEAGVFVEAIDGRMKDLAERKARYTARKEAARGLALAMMSALDLPGLHEPEFTVSVTAGKPKASVPDVDALPEAFVRTVTTRSPDMAMVNAAIRAGNDVPGAVLTNSSPIISIRSK